MLLHCASLQVAVSQKSVQLSVLPQDRCILYRHMYRPFCLMKLRRMEDGSKLPRILKAETCAIQIRTCCCHPENSSHIRCLDSDRLSASVGHEASTQAHDPPVLTVRYAKQVQGLDQGQSVRHLQG